MKQAEPCSQPAGNTEQSGCYTLNYPAMGAADLLHFRLCYQLKQFPHSSREFCKLLILRAPVKCFPRSKYLKQLTERSKVLLFYYQISFFIYQADQNQLRWAVKQNCITKNCCLMSKLGVFTTQQQQKHFVAFSLFLYVCTCSIMTTSKGMFPALGTAAPQQPSTGTSNVEGNWAKKQKDIFLFRCDGNEQKQFTVLNYHPKFAWLMLCSLRNKPFREIFLGF